MILREEVLAAVAGGETFEVEFKRDVNDDELVEAAVCLANGRGGLVLVGVDDDGAVVGARHRHGSRTDPARVAAVIANRTVPHLAVEAEVVVVDALPVVAVRVPQTGPVGTSDGRFVRRALGPDGRPQCLPLHAHEMASRLASLREIDPSSAVLPGATWDDLDPLEFERARQLIEHERGDENLAELADIELARVLGCVGPDGDGNSVTLGGLLLFGREEALLRLVPTHEVAFQVIEGEAVQVNEFMRWPLLRVSEALFERFAARHHEEELMLGMFRVPVPEYDPRGYREALHNALIHRDYARLGTVVVQWHADSIEVSNPGGFPEGVTLDNLLVVPPTPRNPRLADAFKRLGLVERTGRGVDIIFGGCLRYGRPAPDYSRTTDTAVQLSVPGGPPHLQFAQVAIEHGNRRQRNLTAEELLVLHEAWTQRRLTASTAASVTQRSETAARSIVESLVEAGLLEAKGETRGRVYHLSAAVYRALGEPSAFVRTRGFDDAQARQMTLQYVRAHGSITRRQVEELCRISRNQAQYRLRGLVADGELRMVGRGKNTAYVPGPGAA